MGGNALGFTTRRVDTVEFNTLKDRLIAFLKSRRGIDLPDNFQVSNPPSYRAKASHGDIDLVVNHKITPDQLKYWFGIMDSEIAHNSKNPTLSFLFYGVQVDLIRVTPEAYESTLWYLSYNDLNALIGRVATWQGLNYGLQGLFVKLPHKNNPDMSLEVVLTTDPKRAYEVLGYDFERAQRGFETPTDIFEFVVSSQYFHTSFFPFDRNTKTRASRDKKRAMYVGFLEYLKTCNTQPLQSIDVKAIPEYQNLVPEALKSLELVYQKAQAVSKFKVALESKLPKDRFNRGMMTIMQGEINLNPNFKPELINCPDFDALADDLIKKYS